MSENLTETNYVRTEFLKELNNKLAMYDYTKPNFANENQIKNINGALSR
jgi:hypothetical protein